MQKAISRADRLGDQGAAVELRTRLLELYANHLRRGGRENDVPRWARDDLTVIRSRYHH